MGLRKFNWVLFTFLFLSFLNVQFSVTCFGQESSSGVMGSNPSKDSGSSNPVEQVSWEDCQDYISKLNNAIRSGRFSLPTEAQWEYACRAGTTTAFYFGDKANSSQVNHNGNYPNNGDLKGTYREKTTPVLLELTLRDLFPVLL